MAGVSFRRAVWISAVCLGLACPGPLIAQSTAANDVVISDKVIGAASELPADLTKLSQADVAAANAGLREGAEQVFREHGLTGADVSSEVVVLAGRGVLKTRVQIPEKVFYWQYTGTSKENAVIVVCTSRSAHPFDLNGSECERRATQVFGAER
jgi:hypothetical protein